MPQYTSYSEVVRFRVPNGLAEAIAEAAARDLTTSSEFVRRALVERLRSLGIDPTRTNKRTDTQHGDLSLCGAQG